jgi:hypothetical protein
MIPLVIRDRVEQSDNIFIVLDHILNILPAGFRDEYFSGYSFIVLLDVEGDVFLAFRAFTVRFAAGISEESGSSSDEVFFLKNRV